MVTEPPKGYRRIVRVFEASELVLYSAVAVLLVVIAVSYTHLTLPTNREV